MMRIDDLTTKYVNVRDDGTVILPSWLDSYIFSELKASYCKECKDLVVLDWGHREMLKYLGTYFPRSFAESYTIFRKLIKRKPDCLPYSEDIAVFDFGCGTGGELLGMILALKASRPTIRRVRIKALDGNMHALRLLEQLLRRLSEEIKTEIIVEPLAISIDDFYDLHAIDRVVCDVYDFAMVSKAVCEFVTRQQLEENNPYIHITKFLMSKLKEKGILYLSDITTYNSEAQEWLSVLVDEALAQLECDVVLSSSGYWEAFKVSHSARLQDVSKVTWRILRK
ncbi:MAG: hypothetical protein SOW66_08750 [Porphyromonas sp.]|nr:hypothetical protein [Porphyromonas sp.]